MSAEYENHHSLETTLTTINTNHFFSPHQYMNIGDESRSNYTNDPRCWTCPTRASHLTRSLFLLLRIKQLN
jgi:hypothetical protein